MKKRYKRLEKGGRIFILHWTTEGMLFGPDWERVASFDKNESNLERCKTIIRLLNACDMHTERSDYD